MNTDIIKEELLNEIEFQLKFNDFYNIKNKNIKKGKDMQGNLIFISPQENYILYPAKYKELYQYLNDLFDERIRLHNLLNNLKIMIINGDDSNETQTQFKKNHNDYKEVMILINEVLDIVNQIKEETETKEIKIKLKELNKEFEKLNKDKKILLEEAESNVNEIIEKNREIVDVFIRNHKYNKNKKYLSKNKGFIPYLFPIKSASIKYYKKINNNIIKLQI
jgi:hypothetical protein